MFESPSNDNSPLLPPDEQFEPRRGDSIYIVGHGPAILIAKPTKHQQGRGKRGKKKYKVMYPNGTQYHVAADQILACEPARSQHACGTCCQPFVETRGPQVPASGPRRLEYLGRAFDDEGRTASTPSSVFALVATMVGGGVLSLPSAMSQCGFILGTSAILISAMISTWTLDMLVDCARCTGRDTYELIGHAAFGEFSRKATIALVFVLCWLALVAYAVLLGDLLVPIAELTYPSLEKLSRETLRRATLCVATIILSPLCFKKSLGAVRFACYASVGSTLMMGAVIAFRAWEYSFVWHEVRVVQPNGDTVGALVEPYIRLWPANGRAAFDAMPVFAISFMCHFNALPAHQELAQPTRPRMRRVLVFTMSFTCLLYIWISGSGYLYAGSCTCGNILLNFKMDDPLAVLARASLGAVIMLNFPLVCQPCRNALFQLISMCGCLSQVRSAPRLTSLPGGVSRGTGDVTLEIEECEEPSSSKEAPAGPPSAKVHVYLRDGSDGGTAPLEPVDSFLPKDQTVQQGLAEPTVFQRYCLTAFALGSQLVLACYMESVLVVWGILGSTVCFLIGFIMPAAFWRQIVGPTAPAWQNSIASALIGVFFFLAMYCTIQTLINLGQPPCPLVVGESDTALTCER